MVDIDHLVDTHNFSDQMILLRRTLTHSKSANVRWQTLAGVEKQQKVKQQKPRDFHFFLQLDRLSPSYEKQKLLAYIAFAGLGEWNTHIHFLIWRTWNVWLGLGIGVYGVCVLTAVSARVARPTKGWA